MNNQVITLLVLASSVFAIILSRKGFSILGGVIVSWFVFFIIGLCIGGIYGWN